MAARLPRTRVDLVQGLICISLQSSEPKERENLFAYIKEAVFQQRTLFFLLASKIEISLSYKTDVWANAGAQCPHSWFSYGGRVRISLCFPTVSWTFLFLTLPGLGLRKARVSMLGCREAQEEGCRPYFVLRCFCCFDDFVVVISETHLKPY